MMDFAEIEQQVLQLPVLQRTALTQKLLSSLDEVDDVEYERLWAIELQRRIQEIDEGKATLIPMEEVFAELRQRLA